MREFDFNERIEMSEGVCSSSDVDAILLNAIPGSINAWRADERDDINGTDWWVSRESGRPIGVDVKARSKDYSLKGNDDLALELWSDIDRHVIGWTLRTDKQTDYVLWVWQDTGRWCLLPFPMLCYVFWKRGREWTGKYKRAKQSSRRGLYSWKSECLFVPRRVVWAEIYRRYSGDAA